MQKQCSEFPGVASQCKGGMYGCRMQASIDRLFGFFFIPCFSPFCIFISRQEEQRDEAMQLISFLLCV
jgi:hypothetical protein